MSVSEFQNELKQLLTTYFPIEQITTEWRTKMNKGIYSPRVDLAVGPFAIEDGLRYTHEHQEIFEQNIPLFQRLTEQHLINLDIITVDTNNDQKQNLITRKMQQIQWTNLNGRCFIAIEIENEISRKHLMGGAVNASVLGKIGIAVGFTEEKHNAFLNLYRYFQFLGAVEKPTFNTSNLLVISSDQLVEILTHENE